MDRRTAGSEATARTIILTYAPPRFACTPLARPFSPLPPLGFLPLSLTSPSHDGYQLLDPNVPSKAYLIYGFNDGKLHYNDPDGAHVDLPRGDMQCEEGFKIKVTTDGGRSYGKDR